MTTPTVYGVNCPSCSAAAGDSCRTLTTGQRTSPHSARYVLLAELRGASKADHPSNQPTRHLHLVR